MEDIQQKFDDAVSLVQKLPKEGPFKVIHLKFTFGLLNTCWVVEQCDGKNTIALGSSTEGLNFDPWHVNL